MSEPRLTVYEKPTCTTCRKLARLLREEGVDFDRVNYYVEPLTRGTLEALLSKAGLRPRDVLRKGSREYRELGLEDPSVPDDEIVRHLVEHPDLLQRPIVTLGDRAVLARPVEKVRELLTEGAEA